MPCEHSPLRDSCAYSQNGQPLRMSCTHSIILPSRWQDRAESLGIDISSCLFQNPLTKIE